MTRIRRMICCHSTDPTKKHEKIYRCNGCGNLWHDSCYLKNGCCKNRGAGVAFGNETVMYAFNAQESARERV